MVASQTGGTKTFPSVSINVITPRDFYKITAPIKLEGRLASDISNVRAHVWMCC